MTMQTEMMARMNSGPVRESSGPMRHMVATDVEVRGAIDLGNYVDHLDRRPRKYGVAKGTEPATVSLAFSVEGTWRYAAALARQRAPDVVQIATDAHAEDRAAVVAQACRMLSLDIDGRDFSAVVQRDPVLARRVRGSPGLRPVLFGSPYEAACWAIVCHRLRVAQADAIAHRIAGRRGRRLGVGGTHVSCFPAPRQLGELDTSYGISAAKRSRLQTVAEAALAGELDASRLRALPASAAVEQVCRLPGFGPFSGELVVGRGAGHRDLFPAAETHLIRNLCRDYAVDESGLAGVVERWRPYSGWGAFFFREVECDEE